MKSIMRILTWLFGSLDNYTPRSASQRKLTAMWMVVLLSWLHYKFVDHDNAYDFAVADMIFICVLLGLVTAANLIEVLNMGKGKVRSSDKPPVEEPSQENPPT